jgi:hypothetical protein
MINGKISVGNPKLIFDRDRMHPTGTHCADVHLTRERVRDIQLYPALIIPYEVNGDNETGSRLHAHIIPLREERDNSQNHPVAQKQLQLQQTCSELIAQVLSRMDKFMSVGCLFWNTDGRANQKSQRA